MIKKIKFITTVIIVITASLVFFLKPQYILRIEDKTNNKIYEYPLKENKFSLGYTHSVMKTEAEEFFMVNVNKDKKIKLIETEYKSYGVGLPFLPEEGKLTVRDGKFILEINREFKDISMVISPIGKHYLRVNGEKQMLSELLGDKPAKILLTINKKYIF